MKSVIYAFIDSQNLNLGTSKDLYKGKKLIYQGWRLDFKHSESNLLNQFQNFSCTHFIHPAFYTPRFCFLGCSLLRIRINRVLLMFIYLLHLLLNKNQYKIANFKYLFNYLIKNYA